jgi:hypothetical protein
MGLMTTAVVAGVVTWGLAQQQPEYQLRKQVLATVLAERTRSGKPLLNVGCPGERVWIGYDDRPFDACLDSDPDRLSFCHTRRPTLADIRQMPFGTGEFGGTLCSHVLEHLNSIADVRLAVRELERTSDRVWILVPGHHFFATISPEHHLWVEWQPGGYQVIDRSSGDQQFVAVRDPQPQTPAIGDLGALVGATA